ncbi:MAG TPA: citryl-CoA lyase [Candidimonas sp.]|nr:citryl-CoA lyase [Candidimonas sp.]
MSSIGSGKTLEQEAREWWKTRIIDIHPGSIRIKGEPIEQLIGNISFPEMIWRMLRDDSPSRQQAALLEAALVSAVDHGPQAPSIAIARMSVTCGLGLNGAMASAINVLDDIHGGAGEQCLTLYQDILDRASSAELAAAVTAGLTGFREKYGRIVPGFGHRFHPVDPRAVRLRHLTAIARKEGVVGGRHLAVAEALEQQLKTSAGKTIPMNIDGATAMIYGELGFAPELARGLFILSRSVGILAHAWEQKQQGGRIKGPLPPSLGYTYTGL